MDKLRNMNKVILSSLNNYKVELGVIYSIKSFFEEWLSGCDEGEVFYKSIIGNTRAKASKLIEIICDYKNHEYFKDCFISNAGTHKLYENGNKTPEICYVLAKLLRENTFIDETTTRKQQGIDLFNECIDEGENLSKTDSKDDIEKNYLKVVAQAAY